MGGSDPSQVVSLQLLGSKAYGQLRDLIADDQGVLERVESSAWAQGVLRKNPRASVPQELQHRGYDCLQTAATMETGEKVLFVAPMQHFKIYSLKSALPGTSLTMPVVCVVDGEKAASDDS